MNRRTKCVLIILACILYILLPIDLIPDYIPGFGQIDDLLGLVVTLIALWRQRKGKEGDAREAADGGSRGVGGGQAEPRPADPHAVLGVRPGASPEEIRGAYRRLMSQYHPDKVEHLGEELKRTALRKTLEIQRAYEQLGGT